jgi:hypothetical protein
VGTAGDELQQIKEKEDYYIIQKEKYGFLNLKLENNGKTIIGEFHTNNNKVLDNFVVKKSYFIKSPTTTTKMPISRC